MSRAGVWSDELSSDQPASGLLGWAERGWLTDGMIRFGIRRLCQRRLCQEGLGGAGNAAERKRAMIEDLRRAPVAIRTEAANQQHYELPAEFFRLVLGRRLKYSCAYFPRGNETLDSAEEAMLALYGERAALEDGQDILELGCGWGSLTLWMAERFPKARITAVSNSNSQRMYIMAECGRRGLGNIRVITQDVTKLELPAGQYDRCLSVEMFEHLRNYEVLLQRIRTWLRPGGKLFAHVFVSRDQPYVFETRGEDNWLGRHFFTGGLMPSEDTLLFFQRDLRVESMWRIPGIHYERTANLWLQNQDENRQDVVRILGDTYGQGLALLWNQRWRMFWMSCAELFGFDGGRQWFIAHYLFARDA